VERFLRAGDGQEADIMSGDAIELRTGRLAIGFGRWLTLLMFLPGIFCFQVGLPGACEKLVLCSALSFGAALLLLSRYRRPAIETYWCTAILIVFLLGYYLKFYLFAGSVGDGAMLLRDPELAWIDEQALVDALAWTTIAFLCFCLVGSALLSWSSRRASAMPPIVLPEVDADRRAEMQRRLGRLTALTFALGLLTSVLPPLLGFGAMGVENAGLPFHMDAFITRFRLDLAPALLMLILWLAERYRMQRIWQAGLACMLLLAVCDAVSRSSRGSLIDMAFPVLLLWVFTGRMTRPRIALFASLAAITVVLYPVISLQRGLRMQGGADLEQTVQLSSGALGATEGVEFALHALSTRVSGLDGILKVRRAGMPRPNDAGVTELQADRVAMLLNNTELTDLQTYEISGIPRDRVEGRPPTLVGASLIIGGLDGVLLLVPLVTALAWWAWQRLRRHVAAPVMLAFFGSSLMNAVSEGNFGMQDPIAWLVTALIIGALYRRLMGQPARSPITPTPRLQLSSN
jgi:hypothetical protein